MAKNLLKEPVDFVLKSAKNRRAWKMSFRCLTGTIDILNHLNGNNCLKY